MFLSKLHPERAASESPAVDPGVADDQTDDLVPVPGPLPAPAGRFGITDPQRWLDLCG